MSWIGTRGFWIDDSEYCEIVGVVDEGAGMYEFKTLDPAEVDCEDCQYWIGFIEDFFPEDNQC